MTPDLTLLETQVRQARERWLVLFQRADCMTNVDAHLEMQQARLEYQCAKTRWLAAKQRDAQPSAQHQRG